MSLFVQDLFIFLTHYYSLIIFFENMIRNTFISMQKGFLTLMSAALLFSCSNVETFEASDLKEAQEAIAVKFNTTDANLRVGTGYNACGTPMIRDLIVGQSQSVGKVAVFNDNEKFYVTVSITESNWFIHKIHGLFGQAETDFLADPRGKQKKGIINPAPGQFPIKESITPDYTDANQEYTFELEIGEKLIKAGEFDIAVHAELIHVTKFNEEMTEALEYKKESAWGQGRRFNPEGVGNWSMYMSYEIQPCDVACTDTWFRSVTRNNNGEGILDFESDKFELMDGSNVVGQAVYQRSRTNTGPGDAIYKVDVTFTVLDPAYSFDEWGAFYSSSAILELERDDFDDIRMTETGGTVTFTNITGSSYYLGLYAKITGKCK
ncbi:hypothetical protein KI659_06270 [Litoribacter alkaliphilus]|uniref:Uncharacterized protein n=1 Tax=Litoribacter ruber TaxID=702568 RepID=A0AAP2CJA3_9BACT|nr:hypothetical protein [Litoribacter alkaliphilus]MBS9523620.1 hypothetical protein [Litoribacter alkaliphilus]